MTTVSSMDVSWVQVYLQVAVSILVFLVGFPAVLMPLVVSEGVRLVFRKRVRLWMAIIYLCGAVPTAVTLALIWYFDTCEDKPNVLTLLMELAARAYPRAPNPRYDHLTGAILMTIAILSMTVIVLILPLFQRDRVLAQLARQCKREIKKHGRVDEEALLGIRRLGEQSAPGSEKTQVLQALAEVIECMQVQAEYEGNGLPLVLQALESTLRTDTDVDDLLYGILILAESIEKIQKRDLVCFTDMKRCLESLRRIGGMILELDSDEDALAILQAVEPILRMPDGVVEPVAQVLFELGAAATNKRLYGFGVRALNELEAIWGRDSTSSGVSAAYLGLVAHFWAAGQSARERSRKSINGSDARPTLQSNIRAAREHHVMFARFETADKLSAMLVDVEREQSSPLLGLV